MLKFQEVSQPESCLHKALDTEMLFVLLARDPAAPVVIRAWIEERIRIGKNTPDDPQIVEAYECLLVMERQYEKYKRDQEDFKDKISRGRPGKDKDQVE